MQPDTAQLPQVAEAVEYQAAGALVCQLASDLVNSAEAMKVLGYVALGVAAAVAIYLLVATRPKASAKTPLWLVSWGILAGGYGLSHLFDLVLFAHEARHPFLEPGELAGIGASELLVLGKYLWPILPLAEASVVGIVIHVGLWTFALVVLHRLLSWLSTRFWPVKAKSDARPPWTFRLTGCSTHRGLDLCHRAWLGTIASLLAFVMALAVLTLPTSAPSLEQFGSRCPELSTTTEEDGTTQTTFQIDVDKLLKGGSANPQDASAKESSVEDVSRDAGRGRSFPPGLLALTLLLLPLLKVHVQATAELPVEDEEEEQAESSAPESHRSVLERFEAGLQVASPGAQIHGEVEEVLGASELRGNWPDEASALLRRTAAYFTQQEAPYLSQAEALGVVMKALAPLDASLPQNFVAERDAWVLAGPEGAGRLSVLLLAALSAQHIRGGTTLLVCRDRERAAQIWERYHEAVSGTPHRWTVLGCNGGAQVRAALATGRLPGVIVTDLYSLEETLLVDVQARRALEAIDLVLVDEANEFVGTREMHLSLVLKRLWLHGRAGEIDQSPPLVLATVNRSWTGMTGWLSSVLGRRAVVLPMSGARQKNSSLLVRRDLVDVEGDTLSVIDLARACEAESISWHLRMAGDARRSIQRHDGDLAPLRRHRVASPLDADVVILEGLQREVQTEVEVTGLAGTRTNEASVLHIQAAPPEETRNLHLREEGMPWLAPALDPPETALWAHAMRLLASGPAVLSDLDARLYAGRLGRSLPNWQRKGWVFRRSQLFLPPGAVHPVQRDLLLRSASAPAIPPLDVNGVTEDKLRLRDATTGDTLERVDRVTGLLRYYPGAVLLQNAGRFRVLAPREGDAKDGVVARPTDVPGLRCVAERQWLSRAGLAGLEVQTQRLGPVALTVRVGSLELLQRVARIREYAPQQQPRITELHPVREVSLQTHVMLLRVGVGAPAACVARPLVAATAMVLPNVLRTGRELCRVGLVSDGDVHYLGFFDLTPGGNGSTRLLGELLLPRLLRLVQRALADLSNVDADYLRRHYDDTIDALDSEWDVENALRWLVTGYLDDQKDVVPDAGSRAASLSEIYGDLGALDGRSQASATEMALGLVESLTFRPVLAAAPTDDDKLHLAAGLALALQGRPDLMPAPGTPVLIEPGHECRDVPGAVACVSADGAAKLVVCLPYLQGHRATSAGLRQSSLSADAIAGQQEGLHWLIHRGGESPLGQVADQTDAALQLGRAVGASDLLRCLAAVDSNVLVGLKS